MKNKKMFMVVERGQGETEMFVGIFSTKEKAELIKPRYFKEVKVTEVTLDEDTLISEVKSA